MAISDKRKAEDEKARKTFFNLYLSITLTKTRRNKIGSIKYAFHMPRAARGSGETKTETVAADKNKIIK